MRVFWEKVGILGPVFRLGSQGLSDRETGELFEN